MRSLVLLGLLACACGRMGGGGTGGGGAPTGGGAATGGGGGATVDAGAPANIQSALACGTPQALTGMAQAGELQAIELDPAQFPDALCNDGSRPVLYYRPFVGASNRNKWVISLRGGGGCGAGASCAARWCSCASTTRCPFATTTTNFTLNNMSGGGARSADVGGVLHRGAFDNSFENYNQVQFLYCSSDGWSGAARGISFDVTHPITGRPVTYVMHFLGTKILEADVKTLRQDGVAPLNYTLQATAAAMPDLDDAEEVVLVGDSAGGAGVINNLDWFTTTLRQNHVGCDGGAACLPRVMGVIDAVVGPDLSRLDWSNSIGRDAGVTTWASYLQVASTGPAARTGRTDESCVEWHRGRQPGPEACGDISHVVRHHLTTPFFVRMALLDQLISTNYEELGVADPTLGAFTRTGPSPGVPVTFASVLATELGTFSQLASSAEEGAGITTAPGVFAPSCSNHDTIHTNSEVYDVTIRPDGGATYRFFTVFDAWRDGGTPTSVISRDPMRNDTVCPP